ncbi:MAG: hypothetical protein K2G23_08055 [Muribaculaceae bacterium]|nr:hypothetical protein [Muribaculaceae bacterium]
MKQFPYLLILFILLFAGISSSAQQVADMGQAMEYCKANPLEKIEGIWEFPEDNTVVLISSSNKKRRTYDLTILSTPDCRLKPGEKIGEMPASVDSDKFRLSLFTSRKEGILTDPSDCLATFNDREGSITIEKRKFKISSSRISRYLPKFWRLLSLFSVSSPADKLPQGLIRLFPSPNPRGPIYL